VPVTVKREGKKFRVVEASTGNIANNAAGTPADGGGHTSKIQADKQTRAINASLKRRGKI
jgi:hypothetical protein